MPGATEYISKDGADRRRNIKKSAGGGKKNGSTSAAQKTGGEQIVKGPMDLPFFMIIIILLIVGMVMMFSAGYAWAISKGYDGSYYFRHQLAMAGIGIVGMIIVSCIDYHILKKPIIVFGALGLSTVLMILCRVGPFTAPRGDAYRWINIAGQSFQPSEILKLAVILLFATLISNNYSRMNQFKYGVLPFGICLGAVAGLMFMQRHFSGMIIIGVIGITMMFVGGTNVKHIAILGVIAVVCVALLMVIMVNVKGNAYVMNRIIAWRDPFDESLREQGIDTYQQKNSLIAIGSGGLFGLGLGNSRQKFLYLPESKNDFVFAVVCEELGFVGACAVLLMFILFIVRGFYIAVKAPDKFGMMLVVGLVVQIGLQALLNIAVVTNSIPNTGISLPFFSYGGTALIMQLVQMGIVLNVSKQSLIKT